MALLEPNPDPNQRFGWTWLEARAAALEGARIRRWDWTDRWLFRSVALWWITPLEIDGLAFTTRVVLATDFTRAEFLASDWTTMWPDQHECIVDPPDPPDPPPPPPPPPDPDPNPGGSVRLHYEFFDRPPSPLFGAVYGTRTVANPFAAACTVHVTGKSDGVLVINGIAVASPPDAYSPVIVDHRFLLGTGQSFTFGTRLSGNGDVGYNLNFSCSF